MKTNNRNIQWTPDQHVWIARVHWHVNFFHKYVLQYYGTGPNPGMWNCTYGRPNVKLHRAFHLCRRLAPQPLCCSKVNTLLLCARHHWAPYLFSLLLGFHKNIIASINWWMDNNVVYPYIGVKFGNKKEQSTNTHHNMDETLKTLC